MLYRKKIIVATTFLVLLVTSVFAFEDGKKGTFSKLDDGVLVYVKKPELFGAKLIKLQVISDKIIRVSASPTTTIPNTNSLMIAKPSKVTSALWEVKEQPNKVIVSTSSINATITTETGSVMFTDKQGKLILADKAVGAKSFLPTTIDGGIVYQLKQTFASPEDEALYGMGQHQNGIINYKNEMVELAQNNTEVAVPFILSAKNYGLLWDNYSITKIGDSRDFEPMSSLKLFSKEGHEGWLTTTYSAKTKNVDFNVVRPESQIDYEFIHTMKNFPKGFNAGDGTVKWEGSIQSQFTGIHKFLFKYAGYAKIWIDGVLLADRWRQPWNPGTAILNVPLKQNVKHSFVVEWIPNGGESYIGCKWLSPVSNEAKKEYSLRSEAGNLIDYYFVYGSNADEVIAGYRQLTGKATMIPNWSLGFWQSRERYKTQSEILQTVQEFRKRKIPLDNIVLDWSYWEEDKWGSHQFDSVRFANPTKMIKDLHDQYNTHFMISVWPKFYEGIPNYNYLDKNGFLYKRNIVNQQRDWIAKGYTSTFYDAFNPKARGAFWNLMSKQLFSKGVDAWWLDASEPDIFSNTNFETKKQLMSPTYEGSSTQYFNAYPLQNAKGVYEGQRGEKPNQRVFILTRSAFAGIQRYAATTWSGDIASRWHDFKNQIPAGLNFSMSGLPYWTTDIGGFAVESRFERPNAKDLEEWRELMTRWYQYGSFCPLFRSHGQFPYREIYNIAPENSVYYKSMLFYNKLRYQLMPYIYTLAGKTYHENYTIMRGLIMDFAADSAVKNIADQFMFGPSILVNPVYNYQAENRSVYLPAKSGWYDFYSGKYLPGGQTILANAPLSNIPLYVKEGSILPFGPDLQYVAQKPADTITLRIYTGKDATFTLYEDEGTNYNYEQGKYAQIPMQYNEQTKTLTIGQRKGIFSGMLQKRVFNVLVISKTKPEPFDLENNHSVFKSVIYNGDKITIPLIK